MLCAFFLLTWVPWQPTFPAFSLEGSWVLGLHQAFLRHLDFGHQFVFTFGPWGFIFDGFHPRTYVFAVGAWMLLSAACGIGLLQLARTWPARWAGAIWCVAVAALLAISSPQANDVRLFALCWMLVPVYFAAPGASLTAATALLAVAIALVTLVKFSMFVPGVLAVALVSADQLRRRRWPTVGMLFLAAHALLWCAAGQPILSYGPYLLHSFEIVAGYAQGEAHSFSGDGSDLLRFAIVAVGLTAVVVAAQRHTLPRALLSLAVCLLAFTLCLKTGFIRHDIHEVFATTSLAVLALLALAWVWPRLAWVGRSLACALCAAALLLASFSYQRWRHTGLPQMVGRSLADLPARAAAAVQYAGGSADLAGRYRSIWGSAPQKLADLHLAPSTVDAFGFDQWVLMEGGVSYDPRPILQSYLAYTPALSRLNANFLQGPRAPKQLLMQVTAIDGHYPSMEDALSWIPLLCDYAPRQPIDLSLPVLPLERLPRPRRWQLIPLGQTPALLRQGVAVPGSTDPVWAEIDLRLTLKGALLQAAYKAPALNLVVQTADRARRSFRLIPANARGGFLLSPAVLTDADFAALSVSPVAAQASGQRVVGVAVVPDPVGYVPGCYQIPISLRFSRLVLTSESSARPNGS